MDGEQGEKMIKKGKKCWEKQMRGNYKKKIYVYIDMAVDIDIDLIEM